MTSRKLLSLAASFVAGAALIWLFMGETTTSPESPAGDLGRKREERASNPAATREALPKGTTPALSELMVVDRRAQTPGGNRETGQSDSSRSDFDDGLLLDLGYSPDDIRYIRSLWERSKEDERAQDEEVARGEWVPPSIRMAHIREGLRSDLGDDLYDAMLHATHQPNRARIGNVIRSSPGAAAGLRIGDVILSYDGERVFEPAAVKRLAEQGEPGKQVALRIRRLDEDLEIMAASGPLGIRFFPGRETPTPP